MPSVIRDATIEDLEPLLALSADYYAEDAYPHDAQAHRAALRRLLHDDQLGHAWRVDVEGVAAGYLVVTLGFSLEHGGRDAFIDEFYLAPWQRGRGLGRRALEAAEVWCRANGVRSLHLEVERDKPRAQALYREAGFVDAGRLLMTRRLGTRGP